MVTEQEMRQRLQAEIEARQRGETGTKPKGGWIAEVQKAQSGRSSAFTTTPSPKVPTEQELKQELQKEIEIRQQGGEGTKKPGGFVQYVQRIEKQRKAQEQAQVQQKIIEQQRKQSVQQQAQQQKYNLPFLEYKRYKFEKPERSDEDLKYLKERAERERAKQEEIRNYIFKVPLSEKLKGKYKFTPAQSERVLVLEDVKSKLREKGMPGKVVGEFVPTTTGQLVVVGGLGAASVAVPAIGAAVGLGVGALGTSAALNPELEPEQRIAGGISGALGFLSAGTILKPFVRGQLAKFSSKYTKVKTDPAGYKYFETPETGKVGLIESKDMYGAGQWDPNAVLSASFKGSKGKYTGGPQPVATGQSGLFKTGTDITLPREFYVSPAEPTLNIAQVRTSRMGLIDLFKLNKNIKLSLWGGQPQAGVEAGAYVSKSGAGGTYKLGTGTELEAIKGAGTIISDVQKVGTTVIKQQAVDIFTFKTSPGTSNILTSAGTTEGASAVSIFTPLSSIFYPKTDYETEIKTTEIPAKKQPPIIISEPETKPSPPPSKPVGFSSTPSPKPTKPSPTPSIPSPPPSTPTPPPIIPSRPSPPPRKPSYPIIPSRPTQYPTTPSKPPSIPRTPIPPTRSTSIIPTRSVVKRKRIEQPFIPEIRRRGRWYGLGKQPTLKQAFFTARGKALGGLGVSIRVRKGKKIIRLKPTKFFRKAKKEIGVLIQKKRAAGKYRGRLSTRGEKREIFMAKRKKKKFKKIRW